MAIDMNIQDGGMHNDFVLNKALFLLYKSFKSYWIGTFKWNNYSFYCYLPLTNTSLGNLSHLFSHFGRCDMKGIYKIGPEVANIKSFVRIGGISN